MSNFNCPMCTDCPDNCPLDAEEDTRKYSADYYKGRADMKTDIVAMLEREFRIQNNPNSKFEETIVLKRSIIKRILGKGDNDED